MQDLTERHANKLSGRGTQKGGLRRALRSSDSQEIWENVYFPPDARAFFFF